MKHLSPPASEALDDLPLPPAEQHACALQALARLRDETAAMVVEQHCAPINLVAADVYFGFRDPELAGLAVVRMRGDSMAPILQSGDCALIDTRDTHVDEGTFAVLHEKSVVIMRLVRLHESGRSTVRLLRSWPNPLYGRHPNASDPLTLGEDLEIIGRVVRKVTRYL